MNRKSFMPLALLAALGLMRDHRGGLARPRYHMPKGHTRKVYANFNRERECARRRRQIERGIIKVSALATEQNAPGAPGQEVKP